MRAKAMFAAEAVDEDMSVSADEVGYQQQYHSIHGESPGI
jgi:hypothetical protein